MNTSTRANKPAHKNKHRASVKPLDPPTLALTSLGLGFLRPAPGSWGSLPPAALVFALLLAGAAPIIITAAMLALCLVSCAICVAWGVYAEKRFHRKDAAEVVIDETAGAALTFAFLPAAAVASADFSGATSAGDASSALGSAVVIAAVGFLAFRIADILKPPPARKLERLPHGWGVLVDDLAAAVYALIATQVILRMAF